jgi:hypothetical protein
MMLDSPHAVAVIDDGFARMAVDFRDAIGREFQGFRGHADHEQAAGDEESEAYLSHRSPSYHMLVRTFL